MLLKMLPNVLKLCANGVDVVATLYELHGRATNFMDGLGRKGGSRTLSLLNIIWQPFRSEPVQQHFKESSEN